MLFLIVLLFQFQLHELKADEVGSDEVHKIDDVYCQTALDKNSVTLKKTKAWRTCQGLDKKLMQCMGKGYEVENLRANEKDHIICQYRNTTDYRKIHELDLADAKEAILYTYKGSNEFKSLQAEKREHLLEASTDSIKQKRIQKLSEQYRLKRRYHTWRHREFGSDMRSAMPELVDHWHMKTIDLLLGSLDHYLMSPTSFTSTMGPGMFTGVTDLPITVPSTVRTTNPFYPSSVPFPSFPTDVLTNPFPTDVLPILPNGGPGGILPSPRKLWREDLRCGKDYPLLDGSPAQCNPDNEDGFVCCSAVGWCGNTRAHCTCGDCIDYGREGGGEKKDVQVEIGCWPKQDRAVNGSAYRGGQHMTRNGFTCQEWSEQYPHQHKYFSPKYREERGTGEHNSCRNPDEKYSEVWCYTTDPGKRWDWCEVPTCKACYTIVEKDMGHFPEGSVVAQKTFQGYELCKEWCDYDDNCQAVVVSPENWAHRECFLVNTKNVSPRKDWTAAAGLSSTECANQTPW